MIRPKQMTQKELWASPPESGGCPSGLRPALTVLAGNERAPASAAELLRRRGRRGDRKRGKKEGPPFGKEGRRGWWREHTSPAFLRSWRRESGPARRPMARLPPCRRRVKAPGVRKMMTCTHHRDLPIFFPGSFISVGADSHAGTASPTAADTPNVRARAGNVHNITITLRKKVAAFYCRHARNLSIQFWRAR